VATILIVDDDQKLLKMLQRTLTYEGFRVLTARNGNEALAEVQAHRPDAVVLDWLMPGMDGLGVVERLRAAEDKTLVLMLTARDEEPDRITGFELGADDYVLKPFSPRELVARANAILRRGRQAAYEDVLRLGEVELRRGERVALANACEVKLTSKEFDLLAVLIENAGLVLSREKLLDEVWGMTYPGDTRTVDVHVAQLRRKLGLKKLILTVRGSGYKAVRE